MAARKKSKPKNITAKMQTSQSSQSEPRANIKIAAEFARTLTRRLETEFPTIESKIKSYTQQDLENIANSPEQYQKQLVELSNYMYRRSGYFKRIADYFVDIAV